MVYHALPFVDDEFLCSITNTLLIRTPEFTISSLFRMRPDYQETHTGFEGQYHLIKKVMALKTERPWVIDAEVLKKTPKPILAEFFDYIGFPYSEKHLTWQKGNREDWHDRESWHIKTINSQGFEPPGKGISSAESNSVRLQKNVLQSIANNKKYYLY